MAQAREILYGGAAAGGKTLSLLMAAAQYVDVPEYSALLLRKTLTEQKPTGSMVDKTKKWWPPGCGARYNANDMLWTFPSGARIQLAFLNTIEDAHRYRTSEFHFIGIDELTTLDDEEAYRFMFSRLRRLKTTDVPSRMRACTNPGGSGTVWVKRRWGLQGKPRGPVWHEGRLFIPATMNDNPALDVDDYILSLGNIDPITRDQIKEGDWEAFHGGRFRPSWIKRYVKDRGLYYFDDKNYTDAQIGGRFLTVDPAATVQRNEKHDPDWTSISSWGTTPCGKLVWLGNWRGRIEIPDIAKNVAMMYLRYRARKVYCEGFGIGSGPPQLLVRHKLPGGNHMNVIAYNSKTNKDGKGKKLLERAAEAMNLAEAGRLWIPLDDPSFEEAEAEVLRFTGDDRQDGHDDTIENLAKAAMVHESRISQSQSFPRGSLGVLGQLG